MADGLVLRIGADVTPAVQGLQQVEQRMRSTVAAGQSFGKGIDKSVQSLSKLPGSSNQATQSLINLSRVAQDAPYGFIGIANNLNPLLESFQRLKASTGTTGGAFKALGSSLMGPAGLGVALGVASSLLVVFGDRLFGAGKSAEKAKSAVDELKASTDNAFKESAKEATQVGSFISILRNETETRERKLATIKELQKIQPDIFKNIKLEGSAVIGLDNAYKDYLANLQNVIAAKIIQARVEQKIEELLKKQGVAATAQEKALSKLPEIVDSINLKRAEKLSGADAAGLIQMVTGRKEARQKEISELEKDVQNLFNQLQQYSKNIKVGDVKTNVDKATIKPEKVNLDFSLAKYGRLELPVGTAVLRMQELLLDKPKQLTFTETLQNSLTDKIGKLVVTPNIKVAENKELKKQAEERVAMHKQEAAVITSVLTPAFDSMFNALAQGGNAFKAFGQAAVQALTQLIGKLVTTAAIAAILGPVLGIGTTALGSATNSFKDVFGSLFGGFRAAGGPVEAGRAYITGEAGRELFVPSVSGSIVPNHQLGSFSTGRSSSSGTMRAVVRGQNILLSVARTTRSNNRLGLNGI